MVIVVVEDEKETREYLAEFLRDHGHVVLECSNGLSALEITSARKVDLIVSDIRMSGISGIELLKEVRLEEDTPFILITAYAECLDALQSESQLAFQYLLKPLDLDLFADMVGKLERGDSAK